MKSFVRGMVWGVVLGVGVWASGPAAAAEQLGKFDGWTAFKSGEGAQRNCYAVAQPAKSDTRPQRQVRRDPIFFMVTNWPDRNRASEPSFVSGYPFKDASTVTIKVGEDSFELFTINEGTAGRAWMADADEPKLIAALRAGSTMVIEGTSRRDTVTIDTFNLKGVSAALDAIAACN